MRAIRFFVPFFCLGSLFAESPEQLLKSTIDWMALGEHQGELSQSEFINALERVYAPGGAWRSWIRIEEDGAWVQKTKKNPKNEYFLKFRDERNSASPPSLPRGIGLKGLRIAIDPGHIGGQYAAIEERLVTIGDGRVAKEGDLTLATAKRVRTLLENEGATVWLTRETADPASPYSPEDYLEEAKRRLGDAGGSSPYPYNSLANRLFVRNSDIRTRARLLNTEFQPDLTLALHINARTWPNPDAPELVDSNNLHIIVNGTYLPVELADDAQRFEMVYRIAKRFHMVEVPLATDVAFAFQEGTSLDPYSYYGGNATALDEQGYVWSRNLLANRIFRSPVIYYEPWVANSKAVFAWAAEGDYEGMRDIEGEQRESLPAKYASLVMAGLNRYFDPVAN